MRYTWKFNRCAAAHALMPSNGAVRILCSSAVVIGLHVLGHCNDALAADPPQPATTTNAAAQPARVTFDRQTESFDQALPVKKNFFIDLQTAEHFDEAEVTYWRVDEPEETCGLPSERRLSARVRAKAEETSFLVPIQPLAHSTKYCFNVHLKRAVSQKETAAINEIRDRKIDEATASGKVDTAQLPISMSAAFKDYAALRAKDGKPLRQVLAQWFEVEAHAKMVEAIATARSANESTSTAAATSLKELGAPTRPELSPATNLGTADKEKAAALIARFNASWPALDTLKMPAADAADVDSKLDELRKKLKEISNPEKPFDNKQCSNTKQVPKIGDACKALDALLAKAKNVLANVEQYAKARKSHADAEAKLNSAFDEFLSTVSIEETLGTGTKPLANYSDRANFYISADAGLVMPIFVASGEVGLVPVVGANFYFVPVDKDQPLSEAGGFMKQVGQRVALTGGLALGVKDSAGTVTGVMGGSGVVAGIGVRVTDYVRIGAGTMLVSQRAQNPPSSKESLRFLPYVSASLDIDVVGTVKSLMTRGQTTF